VVAPVGSTDKKLLVYNCNLFESKKTPKLLF